MSDEETTVDETSETEEKLFKNIKPSIVVEYLNDLLAADPEAISALFKHRVPCNEAILNHNTVIAVVDAGEDGKPTNAKLGMLGLFNGLIGKARDGWGYIAAEVDEDGELHRFLETPQAMDDV